VSASTLDSRRIDNLVSRYQSVRSHSEKLCQPLAVEDYGIQTMADVSPPKWHLAHTSWFFETFILRHYYSGYQVYHAKFPYLFNSYYEQAGSFHPRPERGLLSRPTVEEVYRYRIYVDQHMLELLRDSQLVTDAVRERTILGLHHEQQHQELLLTDIKHIFGYNPLNPAYRKLMTPPHQIPSALQWHEYDAGIYEIGAGEDVGFAFDNERPRHKLYLNPFRVASRPVTNGEFLEFMQAGGYRRPEYWMSDGWKTVKTQNWQAPLYWQKNEGEWWYMTLGGMRHVDEGAPVCHVSFYEADAFARWSGKRLLSEAEWEVVASDKPVKGNLRETDFLQPIASAEEGITQLYGDVWEWTQSAYGPYPGYQPLSGVLGEYNGKFMCSQIVLRGGSCVTPGDHIRASYRNFFYPADRWQFSGIRLAEDG
jgi:ergothioneine biosynthesis protein EgtB